ncbi:uncharacterized protein [Solanum tuberosum]|uniref:uncharacterized protein n=1 Tax=Solanum tuberosum TaxID=4113 RepID=UPI000739FE97|nr:PREDICTED: uncharacterized protein LOC107061284 [Solanum tuberosum]
MSPIKGVMRFGKKDKLSLPYIRPFEILDCVRPVAYMLALPRSLFGVHPVFHEELVAILDRDVRKLRTTEIKSVKVQWKYRPVEEATWEIEKDMRDKYPVIRRLRLLHSREFTQCAQNAHHRVLTQRAETVA